MIKEEIKKKIMKENKLTGLNKVIFQFSSITMKLKT